MNRKEEFEKYIEKIISWDELQFFCEDCLIKMNQSKPEPFFQDTGICNCCSLTKEVSNPHFNFWLKKNNITLEPGTINSDLRKLIPFQMSRIPIIYNSRKKS